MIVGNNMVFIGVNKNMRQFGVNEILGVDHGDHTCLHLYM